MQHRRTTRYISTQGNLYSLVALGEFGRRQRGSAPKVAVAFGSDQLLSATLGGAMGMASASAAVGTGGECASGRWGRRSLGGAPAVGAQSVPAGKAECGGGDGGWWWREGGSTDTVLSRLAAATISVLPLRCGAGIAERLALA